MYITLAKHCFTREVKDGHAASEGFWSLTTLCGLRVVGRSRGICLLGVARSTGKRLWHLSSMLLLFPSTLKIKSSNHTKGGVDF